MGRCPDITMKAITLHWIDAESDGPLMLSGLTPTSSIVKINYNRAGRVRLLVYAEYPCDTLSHIP